MTIAQQVSHITANAEMSMKAREFVNLARAIALSRGIHSIAQQLVHDNRILMGPGSSRSSTAIIVFISSLLTLCIDRKRQSVQARQPTAVGHCHSWSTTHWRVRSWSRCDGMAKTL
jgi:hypothetical protein